MSTPVNSSSSGLNPTIVAIVAVVLNVVSIIGGAITVGAWKGEVTTLIENHSKDIQALRAERQQNEMAVKADRAAIDIELKFLTARIAQSDTSTARVDERLKMIESVVGEIKVLVRGLK